MQHLEFIVHQSENYIEALQNALSQAQNFLQENENFKFSQLVVTPVFMASPKMMVSSPNATPAARPGYTVTLVLTENQISSALQGMIDKTEKMQDAIINDLNTGEIIPTGKTVPMYCDSDKHDWDVTRLHDLHFLGDRDRQMFQQGFSEKLTCLKCGAVQYAVSK